MGRGDFSRPDIGRLKPPLPQEITPKISSITITKLNNTNTINYFTPHLSLIQSFNKISILLFNHFSSHLHGGCQFIIVPIQLFFEEDELFDALNP
jgi:hypothetical protein